MLASDLERTVTTVTTVTPPPQVLSPDLERMARSFGEMLGFEVTPEMAQSFGSLVQSEYGGDSTIRRDTQSTCYTHCT